MKKLGFCIGAAAVWASFVSVGAQSLAGEFVAGVQHIVVPSSERGADLDVTVWYPALSGGEAVTLGENVFFKGTSAMKDAPFPEGKFPLVLLSHGAGLGGRPEAMSWIATPLAEDGFIVAAPTHPGNTGPDRSAEETMKLWLRPTDISDTLNGIEESPSFQQHVAVDRIGILGLSMGGSTALSLAGAQIDPELLASYCDTDERNQSLCDWVRGSGVDLHAIDKVVAARDNSEPRARFVLAIDPAPVDIFAADTFPTISVPVHIVNLGKASDIPVTAQASGVADAIPGATYQVIEDASHNSMFGECKPAAAEIAIEEGIEDPICEDGHDASRSVIHAQLIDIAKSAFEGALGSRD